MLLRFKATNFRSIRSTLEFSLVAVKTRSDEHDETLLSTPRNDVFALRCAAIYGPNASGKSNILRAMNAFSRMVSDSQRKWKPTGPIPSWDPFLLDLTSRKEATTFEIDFARDSSIFAYGFTFNGRVVIEEWLLDITNRDRTLFRRKTTSNEVKVMLPGKNLAVNAEGQKHLDSVIVQTRPNSLFLSCAAQNNVEYLTTLYKWLTESFFILSPQAQNSASFTAEFCATHVQKERVRSMLEFADTGIVDFDIEDEDYPEEFNKFYSIMTNAIQEAKLTDNIEIESSADLKRKNVTMMHRGAGGQEFPLKFSDESAGTKAYFQLLGPLLSELADGTTVLVDELEASLHPNLARQLVRIFSEKELNPNGAQLVFATHDTNLLDLDLLRRDQIWFAEKAKDGSTSLALLADYKPRTGQNVQEAYLNGRFGAIPFLDETLLRTSVSTIPSLGSEK